MLHSVAVYNQLHQSLLSFMYLNVSMSFDVVFSMSSCTGDDAQRCSMQSAFAILFVTSS